MNPSSLPGRSLTPRTDVAPAGYAPSSGDTPSAGTVSSGRSAPVYVPPASTAPASGGAYYSGSSTR